MACDEQVGCALPGKVLEVDTLAGRASPGQGNDSGQRSSYRAADVVGSAAPVGRE
ncbi:MAG: hypothetical protein ABIK62_03355 [candidate division WOR-3 bacterium]